MVDGTRVYNFSDDDIMYVCTIFFIIPVFLTCISK